MPAFSPIYVLMTFDDYHREAGIHMFNNVSIRIKLLVLLLVPLILFAATGIHLLQRNLSNIDRLTDSLHTTSNQSITLVLNADRDMYQALSAYQQLSSAFVSPEGKEQAKADFEENVRQANDRIDRALGIVEKQGIAGMTHPDSGKSIGDTITEIDRLFNEWAMLAEAQFQAGDYSIGKEARLQSEFDEARANINDFGEILELYSQREVDSVTEENEQTTYSTYIILIAEWIVLIALGLLVIRNLSRTVSLVQARTRQVASGDLSYTPQSKYDKDELGQILFSVDGMIGKMRELIGAIADNSRQVAAASEELAQSAKESEGASSHVAESIQEVTSLVETQSAIAREANVAMEEMAVGVQKIAESTNVISEHSQQTNVMADEGTGMLIHMKEQMGRMASTIGDLSRSVAVLSEKSETIGEITGKITSIANQTGILSLNASIEAARAGEHGKGFAVVAQEIRKLAAISLESAHSINQLIGDTRGEIALASEYMNATVVRNEQGVAALDEVAHGFEAIVESIRQVNRQLHDTSAVTQQMSASSEEVSASMEHSATSAKDISDKAQGMAAATEEQLALVENIAYASGRLQSVVEELNKSVRFFKL